MQQTLQELEQKQLDAFLESAVNDSRMTNHVAEYVYKCQKKVGKGILMRVLSKLPDHEYFDSLNSENDLLGGFQYLTSEALSDIGKELPPDFSKTFEEALNACVLCQDFLLGCIVDNKMGYRIGIRLFQFPASLIDKWEGKSCKLNYWQVEKRVKELKKAGYIGLTVDGAIPLYAENLVEWLKALQKENLDVEIFNLSAEQVEQIPRHLLKGLELVKQEN